MKTIEEVLAFDDSHRETVTVPEWDNAEMLIVSMTAEDRGELEKTWAKRKGTEDPTAFRVDILQRTWKNADGSPFGTPEQIREVMKKNATAVERLVDAGCRVSGWGVKEAEAIAKN